MIGIAFAAIAIGISAFASRRKRASDDGEEDPERGADREAAERLLQRVSQPALQSVERCVQNALAIDPGFGSRNFWMLKHVDRHLPDDDAEAEDDDRRDPVDDACARMLTGSPPRPTRARRRRRRASSSRTSVTSSKKRGLLAGVVRARLWQVDVDEPAIRPGRGLITITRVDRNTASEIECVTNTTVDCMRRQISSSSMFRRSRVISSRAPNGSSIRSSAGSNASARAIATRICMPPESCHGWWSPKPRQLDEPEHLVDPLLRASRGPSRASRAAARRSSRRCASRRARSPGRPCRSRGRRVPSAPACRSPRPCPRSAR